MKKPQKIVRSPEKAGKTGTAAEEKGMISRAEWLKTDLFLRLAGSKFRSRFQLREADFAYIREKGFDTVRDHAADFVRKRLSDAEPQNDGRQTPMRGAPGGHPVFIAQHATGTCCRECLEKWHGMPRGRALTEVEQKRIVDVIMEWIGRQIRNAPKSG